MEQAGLGGTQRYGLDLSDFGERQPLAEEQLRGEPLVRRQRGKGLANGRALRSRGGDCHRRGIACALMAALALRRSHPVRAAPPEDSEGPGRKAGGVAQAADPAQDRDPAVLHRNQRAVGVAEQAPRGAQQPRVPAPGQPFPGVAVTRLHQRDEPFVIAPTGFRLGRWGRGGLAASHMGIVAAAARMVQSCARFVPRFLT